MAKQTVSQYEKMTQTPIQALIVSLSIPTIISMLVTNIYNLADTAFVGRLGNSASGAVGVVFGFMSIIQAMGFMFGQGSGSIISRLLGQQKPDEASRTASTGFFYAFIAGILIAVMSFCCLDNLVMVLGSTETIAPFAKTYITYILLAAPFMSSSFLLNNLLRYEGKAALGMVGLLFGGLLNICGDPIFMFVLHMGIAGAGLSTALSQMVSFCILLSMFLRGKTVCKLSLKNVAPPSALLWNIMATGVPSLLRQGLGSLSTVLLNTQAAVYGDEAVAAMSIVSRIGFFVFSIAIGIGQGFQPVSGFNYGAGKYSRVRKAFLFTVVLAEGLMTVIMLAVLFTSGSLIGIFRDDPKVIEIGTRALRLHCIALLFLPLCMAGEMLFQSTGHRIGAALLSSMRSGLFFIPAVILLPRLRGLYGVEEAQPLAYVLAFIPSVAFVLWFFAHMPKEDT
ncbi:MAG: MATE family efflux transporter [Lachnospiraceae bacterium]|nr:MATE family efflux transporter [Lachnospiraceae bacterium]